MERLHLTRTLSRQVFGQRRLAEPSRFLDEIPQDRLEISGPGRRVEASTRPRFHPPPAAWSAPPPIPPGGTAEFKPGVRVRHPLFGVGTVLRRDGDGEDLKLTVSFAGVGAKRLVARYAGLEPV